MGLVVLAVVTITWIVGLRIYGYFSLISAGLLGFTVYSVPAILELSYPYEDNIGSSATSLVPTSTTSAVVILIAWITFCITIAFQKGPTKAQVTPIRSTQFSDTGFIYAAMLLSVAGYFAIAANDGLLFFLTSREEQSAGYVRLLWRWVNAIGLIAAVLAGRRRIAIIFLFGLIIYFLAGDRTVFIITAVCIVVVTEQGKSLFRYLLTPRSIVSAAVVFAVVIFGKPIYLAVKARSFVVFLSAFETQGLDNAIKTFEPFIQHNTLELTISSDFTVPVSTLLGGLFGQLLIIPTVFGFDSNKFNTEFVAWFGLDELTFGIAGNYWAQGWAVGGYFGVAIFAVIYGITLRLCNTKAKKHSGVLRVVFALLGTLVAVYAHRNSMDNLLSFVRQIVLVSLVIVILSKLIRPFLPARKRRLIRRVASIHHNLYFQSDQEQNKK